MTRGIPTLVMIVLASVDLCRSDPTRAAVFQADGNSETAFEYTQTLQHVHSGMSCAVFCTETRDVCKAWTYDIGEHICHIQTGLTGTQQTKLDGSKGQTWRRWSEGYCRVPFVPPAADGQSVTKNDGTSACNPDFCYFETKRAGNCRRSEEVASECGQCKRVEWRNQKSPLKATLPRPITAGWSMTWKGKFGNGDDLMMTIEIGIKFVLQIISSASGSLLNYTDKDTIDAESLINITFQMELNGVKTTLFPASQLQTTFKDAHVVSIDGDIYTNYLNFVY